MLKSRPPFDRCQTKILGGIYFPNLAFDGNEMDGEEVRGRQRRSTSGRCMRTWRHWTMRCGGSSSGFVRPSPLSRRPELLFPFWRWPWRPSCGVESFFFCFCIQKRRRARDPAGAPAAAYGDMVQRRRGCSCRRPRHRTTWQTGRVFLPLALLASDQAFRGEEDDSAAGQEGGATSCY